MERSNVNIKGIKRKSERQIKRFNLNIVPIIRQNEINVNLILKTENNSIFEREIFLKIDTNL